MRTYQDNTETVKRDRHHNQSNRYLGLRNVLNLLFMVGALVGIIIYFLGNQQTGTIVILVSMLFKIVECVFRFIR